MSVHGLLLGLVAPMEDHLATLDGDIDGAGAAGEAFGRAQVAIETVQGDHQAAANTLLGDWWGERAGAYTDRLGTLNGALDELATTATIAQEVVTEAVNLITQARSRIEALIQGFLNETGPILQAALVAQQAGAPGLVPAATAQLRAIASDYVEQSATELERVRVGLAGLVGRLDVPEISLDELSRPLGGNAAPASTTSTGVAPTAVTGDVAGPAGGGSGGGGSGGWDGGGFDGGDTATKPYPPVIIPPQLGNGVEVNLPDGSTVVAPNEIAAQAVRNALSNLGVPYVWGGTTPGEALDCSGLTMTSYAAAGLEIPRHSAAQAMGAEVASAGELLPGDLVVWDGHVSMYIGNGQIVEAGDPVQVGPLRTINSGMPFLGFYRPTCTPAALRRGPAENGRP
ncbi:MAG: C40 family peptidase [Actinomycetota bacterium]|nr:C40 family peptidase [Actinomycetota bacterium]